MSCKPPIRILSVDDHPVVRRGIACILSVIPGLELAGEAATGLDAIQKFRELRPDIVLMDLRLGEDMDGLQVIALICSEWPQARILVLTTYAGDENMHRALEAGARGYLIKDAMDQDLRDAIAAVCDGRRYVPPRPAVQLVEAGVRVELTQRERQVLGLMAEGLRNKEIADRLGISDATARTHVDNIMGKLGATTRTEAVVIAAQRGFLAID